MTINISHSMQKHFRGHFEFAIDVLYEESFFSFLLLNFFYYYIYLVQRRIHIQSVSLLVVYVLIVFIPFLPEENICKMLVSTTITEDGNEYFPSM